MMHEYGWWMLAAVVVYVVWKDRKNTKSQKEAEALQVPALNNDDIPWTVLDELVLDIARHEELAQWHDNDRTIFRDTPVRNRDVESGWDVFVDDWGGNITDRYEILFPAVRVMTKRQRNMMLEQAMKKSEAARAEIRPRKLATPDGGVKELPRWMM